MKGFRFAKVRLANDTAGLRDLFAGEANAPSARRARDYNGNYGRRKMRLSPKFLEAFGLKEPEPAFQKGKPKRVFYRKV